MWEGQALPHDTKFRNSRGKIVDSSSWSLIHGSSWSGLMKAEPEEQILLHTQHALMIKHGEMDKQNITA